MASVEKVCIVRGEVPEIQGYLECMKFKYDKNAEAWTRIVTVADDGRADLSFSTKKKHFKITSSVDDFQSQLAKRLRGKDRVSVSFE
jgi:hypothetical protein